MQNLLLTLHIVGAAVSGGLVAIALAKILKRNGHYQSMIRQLKVVALFQLISGAILVLVSPGASVSSACFAGGAYLATISYIVYVLKRQIKLEAVKVK